MKINKRKQPKTDTLKTIVIWLLLLMSMLIVYSLGLFDGGSKYQRIQCDDIIINQEGQVHCEIFMHTPNDEMKLYKEDK